VKNLTKLVISAILLSSLLQICFPEKEASSHEKKINKIKGGIELIKSIVEERNKFKNAIDDLEKGGKTIEAQKKRLEAIMEEVSTAFPGGDVDLRTRIEKAISRIQYLEQEKDHIQKNYWQLNKTFVTIAVIAGVALNVGAWFLILYFLNVQKAAVDKEDENSRMISTISFIATRATRLQPGNNQQNN